MNFRKILQEKLEAFGVDIWKTINVNGVERPRLVWMTHGNETSISLYSYCSNVIFCGVLHRGYVDLASAIAGQSDDLYVA